MILWNVASTKGTTPSVKGVQRLFKLGDLKRALAISFEAWELQPTNQDQKCANKQYLEVKLQRKKNNVATKNSKTHRESNPKQHKRSHERNRELGMERNLHGRTTVEQSIKQQLKTGGMTFSCGNKVFYFYTKFV